MIYHSLIVLLMKIIHGFKNHTTIITVKYTKEELIHGRDRTHRTSRGNN